MQAVPVFSPLDLLGMEISGWRLKAEAAYRQWMPTKEVFTPPSSADSMALKFWRDGLQVHQQAKDEWEKSPLDSDYGVTPEEYIANRYNQDERAAQILWALWLHASFSIWQERPPAVSGMSLLLTLTPGIRGISEHRAALYDLESCGLVTSLGEGHSIHRGFAISESICEELLVLFSEQPLSRMELSYGVGSAVDELIRNC